MLFDFYIIWPFFSIFFSCKYQIINKSKSLPSPSAVFIAEIAVIKLSGYIWFTPCLTSWGNWWASFARQSFERAFCGKYRVFRANVSRENDGERSRGEIASLKVTDVFSLLLF